MTGRRGKTVSEAEFRRMWRDKSMTLRQVGEALGITQAAVSARAGTRGLPPRAMGPVPIITDSRLFKAMWAAGVHNDDIARAFGVNEKTVRNHAKRIGLQRKAGGRGQGITAAQFAEARIAAIMAAGAQEIRAQWALAEMVDGKANTGRWAA